MVSPFGNPTTRAKWLTRGGLRLHGGKHRHEKESSWLPLASLPFGERAWIDPDFGRERPLRLSLGSAEVDQPLGQSRTDFKRIEAKELDHSRHVVHLREGGVALLPVDHRHLVASDDFRGIGLPQPEVEPTFADHLADGLWVCRVAVLLCKVGAYGGTNPMICDPAKRQRIPEGSLPICHFSERGELAEGDVDFLFADGDLLHEAFDDLSPFTDIH